MKLEDDPEWRKLERDESLLNWVLILVAGIWILFVVHSCAASVRLEIRDSSCAGSESSDITATDFLGG